MIKEADKKAIDMKIKECSLKTNKAENNEVSVKKTIEGK